MKNKFLKSFLKGCLFLPTLALMGFMLGQVIGKAMVFVSEKLDLTKTFIQLLDLITL